MARSTGIILAAGGITLANEAVFAPLASGGNITAKFNWRIIPATIGAAVALGGLEHVSAPLATGIAWISLVTVLFAKLGNAEPPVVNAANMLGFKVGKV